MDCKRFERLLALDSGHDLAPCEARALAAHLEACEPCRRVRAEFAATRELLGAYEPPEFDAAFFDSIRHGVLDEIDASNARPTGLAAFFGRSPLLRRAFAPHALAFAAALALVVAAGALALMLRGGRTTTEVPVQVAADAQSTPPAQDLPTNSPTPSDATTDNNNAGMHQPLSVSPSPVERVRDSAPPRRQPTVAVKRTPGAKKEVAPYGVSGSGETETATVKREAPAPFPTSSGNQLSSDAVLETAGLRPDDERRMLRIELQTSDPNVRIIWLTPQPAETTNRK